MRKKEEIDWNNLKALVSDHFTVGECTYLPSFSVHHKPNDLEKDNLIKLCEKLELVRAFFGKPLNVHVMIRPISVNCDNKHYDGKNYNQSIGGAPRSAHITGEACDFNVYSMGCEEARHLLEPKLKEFDIRMEANQGNWLHVDTKSPNPNRYFKP